MEGAAVICVLGLFIVPLSLATLGLIASGNTHWAPHYASRGKKLFAVSFLIVLLLTLLAVGPLATIQAWPLWATMLGAAWVFFAWLGRSKPVRSVRPTLSERITPYVGQVPPPWLHQTIEHGVEGHSIIDGKVSQDP